MKFDLDTPLNTETGIFRRSVNGITVGYFVGWRYILSDGARNIRAGLYFDSPEDAKAFRERLEARRHMFAKDEQIA